MGYIGVITHLLTIYQLPGTSKYGEFWPTCHTFWAFFFQGKNWAWYYETLDLRELQHTPGPHPRSSTTCLWFGNPFIFVLLGILGLCSRGLEWNFLRIKTPNRIFLVLCLEDHPRTCEWLGSPPFISAMEFGQFGRGPTTRSLGDKN